MDACDGSSSDMEYPNEGSKPPNASDPFFNSGWDPISSLTKPQFQHYPRPPIWYNQLITSNSTPELPRYQSESNFLWLQNLVDRGFSEDGWNFWTKFLFTKTKQWKKLRREKISERMRLLQELVPGCNKITGKAVMLDEIINYVQSLQQQVEFQSMTLATLIPDISTDLERALTKEVLQSHGRDALLRGLGPGALPYAQGIF